MFFPFIYSLKRLSELLVGSYLFRFFLLVTCVENFSKLFWYGVTLVPSSVKVTQFLNIFNYHL